MDLDAFADDMYGDDASASSGRVSDASGGDESYIVSACASCPDASLTCPPMNDSHKSAPMCANVSTEDWWEDVVVKNDANYANTKRALEITEQFIGDNNLILIGGMAIDMALKLVGRSGIYQNEKLPDYDFLSPDTAAHSAQLAHLLCKAHLVNVSAINAMHTTTIKVRCNFTPAADIGFCPKRIYDELPTLKIGRLRIIHPHFQIIDIHRSLSYPFDRAQVIGAGLFYRWKKDCTRYDLLLDAYPIECVSTSNPALPGSLGCTIETSRIVLDAELLAGDCLAGWAAISYWKCASASAASCASVEIPVDEPIHVFTDDFSKYIQRADIANSDSILYFEAVLGHLPRHVKLSIAGQKYEIFDNYGALLSAEPVGANKVGSIATRDAQSASNSAESSGGMYIANLQHCMLFLINMIYISARGASEQLKSYCRAQYVECTQLVSHSDKPGIIPSINVFGSANWDESYLIGRRKFVARLSGVKLQDQDVIDGIYPAEPKCSASIPFDYKKSPYFAISGARTGAFIRRELPSVG